MFCVIVLGIQFVLHLESGFLAQFLSVFARNMHSKFIEQEINIKLLVRYRNMPLNLSKILRQVYGQGTQVFASVKQFQYGMIDIRDKTLDSATSKADKNMEKLTAMVRNYC